METIFRRTPASEQIGFRLASTLPYQRARAATSVPRGETCFPATCAICLRSDLVLSIPFPSPQNATSPICALMS
ncbi:hypothetical protein BD410DRAFT_785328 [Rickenella mellea]|uniref:Uncharacterized protein n=1 Tax=Rickenella mellea TaxID=50990 RepID=A0A4Y7QDH1_9AGAM|nr:hypothetical protein BD410DRAFT_785328 [Rickenella mellea]